MADHFVVKSVNGKLKYEIERNPDLKRLAPTVRRYKLTDEQALLSVEELTEIQLISGLTLYEAALPQKGDLTRPLGGTDPTS